MKLNGIKTEYIDVEVNEQDIIEASIAILKTRNEKLIPYSYIDNEGYWQEWLFDSHHNGSSVYDKKRKATKEEQQFNDFLKQLNKYFRNK